VDDLPIVHVLYRQANLREPLQDQLLGEGGLALPRLSDALTEVSALGVRHDDVEVPVPTLERGQKFDDELAVQRLQDVRLPD
jgi:hypothetical protein